LVWTQTKEFLEMLTKEEVHQCINDIWSMRMSGIHPILKAHLTEYQWNIVHHLLGPKHTMFDIDGIETDRAISVKAHLDTPHTDDYTKVLNPELPVVELNFDGNNIINGEWQIDGVKTTMKEWYKTYET